MRSQFLLPVWFTSIRIIPEFCLTAHVPLPGRPSDVAAGCFGSDFTTCLLPFCTRSSPFDFAVHYFAFYTLHTARSSVLPVYRFTVLPLVCCLPFSFVRFTAIHHCALACTCVFFTFRLFRLFCCVRSIPFLPACYRSLTPLPR